MGTLLALDIALRTGWAHDDETRPGVPRVGTFRVPAPSGSREEGRELGASFCAFRQWLHGLLVVLKPSRVVFEAPLARIHYGAHGPAVGQSTVRLLFGLAAIAEMTAHERGGIDVTEANLATVKRYFTGHGRADKAAMMQRCRLLGWKVEDDNQADAAALWAYTKALEDKHFSIATTPLFGRSA